MILYVIIFLLSFLTSSFCKFDQSIKLKQQPEPYVFGIIWPILYICIGFSANTTKLFECKMLIYFLIFLLNSWIIVYNCVNSKKNALYILSIIKATVILIMCVHEQNMSKIAMLPLLAWIQIAYSLNWDYI